MINETFVASDPKSAYELAVEKYGSDIQLLSAKQLKYDDGQLRCEIEVGVPEKLYLEKTLRGESVKSEEEKLLGEVSTLREQLGEMRSVLHEQISSDSPVISQVKALLAQKGIASKWLDATINSLIGSEVVDDATLLLSYCLEEIDDALKVKEENLSERKMKVLVGPTGVGKTTSLAKLAARYAYLMGKPYKVALLNLDNYKVGAIEQLKYYADIMHLEHIVVENLEALKEIESDLEAFDVILVDTAGMSAYDTQKFINVVEYVNSLKKREVEVSLVIPATLKYEDMEDIYQSFSFLNLDSVIISKFDETRHLGTLMNFMLLYPLPMSYFSIGQEVPDDLIPASKEYLLERFIGDIDGA